MSLIEYQNGSLKRAWRRPRRWWYAAKARFWPQAPGFTLSSYSWFGGLGWMLLATFDYVAGAAQHGAQGVLAVAGTATAVGLLYGLGAGILLRSFHDCQRWVRLTAGFVITGVAAWWLALALNVPQALAGPNAALAWAALAASIAAGGVITLTGAALTSSRSWPRGFAVGLTWRWRWLPLMLCFAAGAAACIADRQLWRGTYFRVHSFLQWFSWYCVFVALVLVWPRWRPRRVLVLVSVPLLMGLSALPLLIVSQDDQDLLLAIMNRPLARHVLIEYRNLTDVDRDGYSSLLGGTDCAPFDGQVGPGAQEVPGNGVDDDCLGGDANYLAAPPENVPIPTDVSPTSVVLITVDTLRPDRMAVYGASRNTTPNLTRWSKGALRFERAYTGGAWTSLALSSLFRGVYPRRLSWTWVYETNQFRLLKNPSKGRLRKGEKPRKVFGTPMHDRRPALARYLRQRGMSAVAVVDDGHSMFLEPTLGIAGVDAFSSYFLADSLPASQQNDEGVTRRALKELESLGKSVRPFFLWVHYFGPHGPNSVRPGVTRFGNGMLAGYDHEIAYWDRALQPLLRRIDRLSSQRSLGVIITADHGEDIGPTFRGHGGDLLEHNIHVPLLIRGPDIQPGVTRQVVSLVDLFPTIMAWTKTPGPNDIDGRDLTELLRIPDPGRTVLSETWRFTFERERELDLLAAVGQSHKLTWDLLKETKDFARSEPHLSQSAGSTQGQVQLRAKLRGVITRYLEQNRIARHSDGKSQR